MRLRISYPRQRGVKACYLSPMQNISYPYSWEITTEYVPKICFKGQSVLTAGSVIDIILFRPMVRHPVWSDKIRSVSPYMLMADQSLYADGRSPSRLNVTFLPIYCYRYNLEGKLHKVRPKQTYDVLADYSMSGISGKTIQQILYRC